MAEGLDTRRGVNELLFAISGLGINEDCSEDDRTTRRVFTIGSLVMGFLAPIWGSLYIAFGEVRSGLIPSSYAVITFLSFFMLWRSGGWQWFRLTQIGFIFFLPFLLMASLGGFVLGSVVAIWALLAPLSALWGGRSKEALGWSVAFVVCMIGSGLIESSLRDTNELPAGFITAFFVLNVSSITVVVFLLLDFFVRQKDTMISVMRRNRELESAYLAQEVMLRQNDKLATLGKLSAGMAHELNNPTAAAQQATQQLSNLLLSEEQRESDLAGLGLAEDEKEVVDAYAERIGHRAGRPEFLDPLERSDREAEIQDHLERVGVDDAWRIAPSLVGLGLDATDLRNLADRVRPDQIGPIVGVLANQHTRRSLIGGLDESTQRIIQIVKALKSYTHLDQAPRQLIDVHEGLDSTLVMMQNRLKTGIEVHRSYREDLPHIEAFAGELNQVWTNILDNAIDAMDGNGVIEVTTDIDGDVVVVSLSDSGPGVPPDIVDQIFDPFVTTKPPGEGTGLGLNISYNIVTQKHGGEIEVVSKPGHTTFTVRLPITGPGEMEAPTSRHSRRD